MPSEPYLISGTITNSNGSAGSSLSVTLTNETTGKTLTETTDSNGHYIFDLNNLSTGYSDGDIINVVVEGSGTNGKELVIQTRYYGTSELKLNKMVVEVTE